MGKTQALNNHVEAILADALERKEELNK